MNLELYFKSLIAHATLSHAYMLWGYGSERENNALSLAGFLETGEWKEKSPLLDCMILEEDEGSIGIGEAHSARRFLWQGPVCSTRKMLMVKNAEFLTLQAQNALLKIVEEPPARGLIIFIARDSSVLLPALSSRFQKIYVPGTFAVCNDALVVAHTFITAPASARKEIIKELMEGNDREFAHFTAALMAILDEDPIKNHAALQELTHRMMLMGQFTTNRRLQLEAVASLL